MSGIQQIKLQEALDKFGPNTTYYIVDLSHTLNLLINAQNLIDQKTTELRTLRSEIERLHKGQYTEMSPDDIHIMRRDYGTNENVYVSDVTVYSGTGTETDPVVIQ